MGTEDVYNFRGKLRREHRRLEEDDDVAPEDKEAIKAYARAKDGEIGISTLYEYRRRLRLLAEFSDIPLVECELEDVERLLYDLRHEAGLSESTIHNRENALCGLLNHLGRDWVEDINRTRPDHKKVQASDMLEPEDIRDLIDACRHQRDVALIEFLADTGARLAMTISLRVKDVDLEGETATYQPNAEAIGLKGAAVTPYPIIDSAATVRSYLRDSHPRSDEPEAALFHKMQNFHDDVSVDDGAMSPKHIRRFLSNIADRAGVEKPVNPHNFRHSAITRMYREGYSKGQIQHRVHWTLDTEMWERYVHLEAEELNQDIFSQAGVVDDNDGSDPRRQRCGNCNETLAPHHLYCPRCSKAVAAETRDKTEIFQTAGIESLADGDLTASERRVVSLALQIARHDNASIAHADPSISDG